MNQEGNRAHNWSLTAAKKELKRSTRTLAASSAVMLSGAAALPKAGKGSPMVSDGNYRAAGVGRGWKMVLKVQRNHPQAPGGDADLCVASKSSMESI